MHIAHATSCQVYPSEYAYRDDSVSRAESASANCRKYMSGLQEGVYTDQYTHCDGTQRKLTDTDLGQEQYLAIDYYVWPAGSDGQLLFIFPTAVSLTTITLHYYSDNHRGLPRLRFYAVPDDFDIWSTPTTSYSRVIVPPGEEPAGRRNICINDVNFNTKKVLMYKFSSSFLLSVSEVELLHVSKLACYYLYKITNFNAGEGTITVTSTTPVSEIPTSSIRGKPDNTNTLPEGLTTATSK